MLVFSYFNFNVNTQKNILINIKNKGWKNI
jgi:hypothetical protein